MAWLFRSCLVLLSAVASGWAADSPCTVSGPLDPNIISGPWWDSCATSIKDSFDAQMAAAGFSVPTQSSSAQDGPQNPVFLPITMPSFGFPSLLPNMNSSPSPPSPTSVGPPPPTPSSFAPPASPPPSPSSSPPPPGPAQPAPPAPMPPASPPQPASPDSPPPEFPTVSSSDSASEEPAILAMDGPPQELDSDSTPATPSSHGPASSPSASMKSPPSPLSSPSSRTISTRVPPAPPLTSRQPAPPSPPLTTASSMSMPDPPGATIKVIPATSPTDWFGLAPPTVEMKKDDGSCMTAWEYMSANETFSTFMHHAESTDDLKTRLSNPQTVAMLLISPNSAWQTITQSLYLDENTMMKNKDLRRALMDYQIAPDYMLTSGQLTSATEIPTLAKNQQLRVDIVPKPRTVYFLGARGYPNVKAIVENIIVCDIVAYIVDSVPISEQADQLLTKAGLVPAG